MLFAKCYWWTFYNEFILNIFQQTVNFAGYLKMCTDPYILVAVGMFSKDCVYEISFGPSVTIDIRI